MNTDMTTLPEYVCHKHVHAARIMKIHCAVLGWRPEQLVVQADPQSGALRLVELPDGWIVRHKPESGGMLVIYGAGTADEYFSYSPDKPFVEGYTRFMPPKWEAANKLMGPSLMQYRPMPRTQIDPALGNASLQAITTELVKCIVDFLLANRRENEAGSVSVRIGGVETVRMIPKPEAKAEMEVAVQTRKPKIGDIVLYNDHSFILPAVILFVHIDNTCLLLVHGTLDDFRVNDRSEGNGPSQWSWPK